MTLLGRFKERIGRRRTVPEEVSFAVLFSKFQKILEKNNLILELMASMGQMLGGAYIFDRQYLISSCQEAANLISQIIYDINAMAPKKYIELYDVFEKINSEIQQELAGRMVIPESDYTIPYQVISREFSDVVGGKNANLGEVKNLLGLTTPDGFAVTTRAFQLFMEHNGIQDRIAAITSVQEGESSLTVDQLAENIQQMIMAGSVPPSLERAMRKAAVNLLKTTESKHPFLAVRSSAWGEDTELTFAGIYQSVLNETPDNVAECYKTVLASAYSATAIEYRRHKGFSESEVAMAVGCQVMVPAKASGVVYSFDPQDPQREVLLITTTFGLGAPLVSGLIEPDRYVVSRKPPHEIIEVKLAKKTKMLVTNQEGGTQMNSVPEDMQTATTLSQSQVRDLVEKALIIERYFKKPQDIEWALDQDDQFYFLQARPLNVRTQVAQLVCDIHAMLKNFPVIFSRKGVIAQRGVGIGRVFVVQDDRDLEAVPQGAILVTKHTSPRVAKVIRRVNGIITDVGSSTGHMATIAREFRVPTIVNTEVATQILKTGQEITLDAEDGVVYAGIVKELCYYSFTEDIFEETYEYRLLNRVLKRIAPLNLLDPQGSNFKPSGCKTFHDITRFVHEKAVDELVNPKLDIRFGAPSRKLKAPIPLGLTLIDLGGGLNASPFGEEVEPDDIISLPMRALLEGMTEPGMWATEPMSVDFQSFMSSLTRTFTFSNAPKYLGQNLAVISKEYANLSLRLGYHFNIVDSYISENLNDNYAYFRFLGGVTDLSRRSRRVRFLAEVLAQYDFRVDVRGDMVVARIKKLDAPALVAKVRILGWLVAFTRQLDVKMLSDEHVTRIMEDFMELAKSKEAIRPT